MDFTINDALQTKCQACGGIMAYSPKRKMLECVYCGSTKELDLTPAAVKENSYERWAKQSDENLKEQTVSTVEVKCQQCGAFTTLPPDKSSAKCAFCGTPLITQDAKERRFWQPNYILPFEFSQDKCSEKFKSWLCGKWFAPSKLKKGELDTDCFKGVYLPFWTYDADTVTRYLGERGIESREKERNEKGEETYRTVTHWTTVDGVVHVSFDDVIVPATKALPENILNDLSWWDLNKLVPYNPEFLAGFITDLYTIDFRKGLATAKSKMKEKIESEVKADIGGDKQRIKSMDTDYNNVMFKLILLPLWISVLRYKGKAYQFVLNGRTGEVTGEYPLDKLKVFLTVLAVLIVSALLLYWLG